MNTNGFYLGQRVQFKEWDEMVKEFGRNQYGNINIPFMSFAKKMEHLCGTYATVVGLEVDRGVELGNFTATGDTVWEYTLDMLKPADESLTISRDDAAEVLCILLEREGYHEIVKWFHKVQEGHK